MITLSAEKFCIINDSNVVLVSNLSAKYATCELTMQRIYGERCRIICESELAGRSHIEFNAKAFATC